MTNDAKPEDLLQARKALFEPFVSEAAPVLDDFLPRLGLPPASAPGFRYAHCLKPFSDWLRVQTVPPDGVSWLVTVVGYLVGNYLIERFEGRWMVNESVRSSSYARYVISGFRVGPPPSTIIDPVQLASDCILMPVGRDLQAMVAKVESLIQYRQN